MTRRGRLWGASAAAAVVVAAGVTAGVLVHRRKRTGAAEKPSDAPEGAAAPSPPREPAGGYEARWRERAPEAMRVCRADAEVQTWPQAVACALTVAYPEAGPWSDPSSGSAWMSQAAALVELDLAQAVDPHGGPVTQWQALAWLRADREALVCASTYGPMSAADMARCVAYQLYPTINWSSPQPGWQQDLLALLRRRFLAYARLETA